MGAVYAAVADVIALGRPLTATEQAQTEQLLPIASAMLRTEASKRGYDLDEMIAANPDLADIAKMVTVSAVLRSLSASAETSQAVSQGSQSGLGYLVSYTYLNAGQSLYFLRNELRQLGLTRQKCGILEVFDLDGTPRN